MSLGDDRSVNFDLGESPRNGRLPAPVDSPPQHLDDIELGATRLLRTAVQRPRWEIRYAQNVAISDLVAMTVSLAMHWWWWGDTPGYDHLRVTIALAVMALTAVALGVTRAWDPSVLGQGSEEFSRLLRALVTLAVVVGLVGLALKLSAVRPYVFGVIPVAFIVAAVSRVVQRKVLHRRRNNGACMHEVLAVGTEAAVANLASRTRRATHHGWVVTGACTPSGAGTDGGPGILNVPVVGDLDSVPEVAASGGYRVVSVSQTPGWSSRRLHHLAWDLEGTGAELVVDPGLMEIAGPRLHVAAVDGLPLLRLTEPAFTGLPRVVKGMIDRLGACLLLVVIAPVMIALAIASGSDGGPVFYRQSRIGKAGRPFPMIKFRSMAVKADQRQSELAESNQGAGPLFKLHRDPRVTRVGPFLRKYSLDELPQLFNVLAGSM